MIAICCRTSVYPLDHRIAVAVLQVGQFRPTFWPPGSDYASTWERSIPEEGTKVTASLAGDALDLTIAPSISAYVQHSGKRITAGVYFEIAAKYAEKVGGKVIQRATVTGCKSAGDSGLLLAHYPDLPLTFDRVCSGFQSVLMPADETAAG
ncbi:MAG TPA: hypothetical protein VNN21_04215 [Dehalococcoidia bacterium]|nr:hypothetical protein [Dehalococcoidia bacterium]